MTGAYTLCVVTYGGVLPYYGTGGLLGRFDLLTVHAIYLTVAAVVSAAEILLIRETAFDDWPDRQQPHPGRSPSFLSTTS